MSKTIKSVQYDTEQILGKLGERIKNHSFYDGNKHIAAIMLLYFLDNNKVLFCDRRKRIENSTLAVLIIIIAEFQAEKKEMMVSVVMNCVHFIIGVLEVLKIEAWYSRR